MNIAIIGNAGSGKSTFALKLHQLLKIPLYHLDQYFWKPGWVEPDRAEFEIIHNQLCDKPEWIIDGMAIRFLEYRIAHADIIIFFDISRYLCFYRVLKRAFMYYGTVYFSSAHDCPERGPDIKFLKFIWKFNAERKPTIEALLEKYKDKKEIFIVRDSKDLDAIANHLQEKYHR